MTKPKAINRKKLVAFVLSIIAKRVGPMPNEKIGKNETRAVWYGTKADCSKYKEKEQPN